jgi:hypothetical protein
MITNKNNDSMSPGFDIGGQDTDKRRKKTLSALSRMPKFQSTTKGKGIGGKLSKLSFRDMAIAGAAITALALLPIAENVIMKKPSKESMLKPGFSTREGAPELFESGAGGFAPGTGPEEEGIITPFTKRDPMSLTIIPGEEEETKPPAGGTEYTPRGGTSTGSSYYGGRESTFRDSLKNGAKAGVKESPKFNMPKLGGGIGSPRWAASGGSGLSGAPILRAAGKAPTRAASRNGVEPVAIRGFEGIAGKRSDTHGGMARDRIKAEAEEAASYYNAGGFKGLQKAVEASKSAPERAKAPGSVSGGNSGISNSYSQSYPKPKDRKESKAPDNSMRKKLWEKELEEYYKKKAFWEFEVPKMLVEKMLGPSMDMVGERIAKLFKKKGSGPDQWICKCTISWAGVEGFNDQWCGAPLFKVGKVLFGPVSDEEEKKTLDLYQWRHKCSIIKVKDEKAKGEADENTDTLDMKQIAESYNKTLQGAKKAIADCDASGKVDGKQCDAARDFVLSLIDILQGISDNQQARLSEMVNLQNALNSKLDMINTTSAPDTLRAKLTRVENMNNVYLPRFTKADSNCPPGRIDPAVCEVYNTQKSNRKSFSTDPSSKLVGQSTATGISNDISVIQQEIQRYATGLQYNAGIKDVLEEHLTAMVEKVNQVNSALLRYKLAVPTATAMEMGAQLDSFGIPTDKDGSTVFGLLNENTGTKEQATLEKDNWDKVYRPSLFYEGKMAANYPVNVPPSLPRAEELQAGMEDDLDRALVEKSNIDAFLAGEDMAIKNMIDFYQAMLKEGHSVVFTDTFAPYSPPPPPAPPTPAPAPGTGSGTI